MTAGANPPNEPDVSVPAKPVETIADEPVATAADGPEAQDPHSIQITGPSGVLKVWLGGAKDPAALEADVRAVSGSILTRAATAMALGDVARRHRLEVRVIPRKDDSGSSMLVLFGRRIPRPQR